ncbi:MAG: hypothetical protein LKJ22_00065 [Liquorilactobacillus nagelii]|jgi:predicted small secreted protein|uniref:hypothetical protein n=1 Tax=Liquorilactobacillus nagelii TaxID=82688 RepID=UPI0006EFC857|nr:hypothetical protein [Liquorilactobacillus nagelii]KRL39999.1 hypothetical protein FD45_GL000177 [Liquorilactobacillus nagelii DSM 13675]MCI1634385.1 hypothetical protein [Liquorilactobacillus nagelii]MCI1920295.1 hypothetical protein [Liquorilactobacillus nagelii]MCI1975939.1 hypothetical protein [Liquorilactobacillus nagelii]MCP9314511.1 hypothetical protein [Liquorilactobacillus nagelii]
MNVKSRSFFPLLLGAIAGFISGLQASGLFQKSGRLTPQQILHRVRHEFQKETPIQDSWINTRPEPFQKFALKTFVYHGGVSRLEDQQLIQYDFLADANTGSILELKRNNFNAQLNN